MPIFPAWNVGGLYKHKVLFSFFKSPLLEIFNLTYTFSSTYLY